MLMISQTICDNRYQTLKRKEHNAKPKKEWMGGIAGTDIHRVRRHPGTYG
jgi:hypothetical protein